MTKHLTMLEKPVGQAVAECLNHWERPSMRGSKLGQHFKNWISQNEGILEARNIDNLFEWLVAMNIARDAHNKEWQLQTTRENLQKSKYGDFFLKKEDIFLRISKGKPTDGNGRSLRSKNSKGEEAIDLVTQIARRHGLNASGFEPDIILTFFKSNNPTKTVTFLADAKNNGTGDGKAYIRSQIDKAVAYVFAFNEILDQTPKCTLFFRQSALSGKNLNSILKEISERPLQKTIDDVLCINNNIFNPVNSSEWFKLIEKKALQNLCTI